MNTTKLLSILVLLTIYGISPVVLADGLMMDEMHVRDNNPFSPDTIDNLIATNKPLVQITNNVYEGDVEVVSGVWRTTTNISISNGSVRAELVGVSTLLSHETATDRDGMFQLTLDYTATEARVIIPGDYTWKIMFEKEGYQHWNWSIPITIVPHSYNIWILLEPGSLITQGQPYFISAEISYDNYRAGGSDTVGTLTSRDEEAFDIPVIFMVNYTATNGDPMSLSKTTLTDRNGIARFNLSSDETIQIQKIDGISARIDETQFNNAAIDIAATGDLPNVTEGTFRLSDLSFDRIGLLAFVLIAALLKPKRKGMND